MSGRKGVFVLPTANISFESMARHRYVSGQCDVEELERDLETIMRGELPDWVMPTGLPPAPVRESP